MITNNVPIFSTSSGLQQPRFGGPPLRQLQAPQEAAAQRLQGLRQQVLPTPRRGPRKGGSLVDFPGKMLENLGMFMDFMVESDGIHWFEMIWMMNIGGRGKKMGMWIDSYGFLKPKIEI